MGGEDQGILSGCPVEEPVPGERDLIGQGVIGMVPVGALQVDRVMNHIANIHLRTGFSIVGLRGRFCKSSKGGLARDGIDRGTSSPYHVSKNTSRQGR